MEIKRFSVYGIPPLSPEEIILKQHRLFMYLEALVRAERLNPDIDYDMAREIELLKRVGMSDLTVAQRTTLTLLIYGNEEIEEVENDGNDDEED